jgi:hypothetical protein
MPAKAGRVLCAEESFSRPPAIALIDLLVVKDDASN